MLRRTVLLAAVAAFAGCQGPGPSTNSAFKLPTPSFNLLAPYGSPRIPPPGTHSYGQSGFVAPSAASAAQPYYPGTSVRGVSHPQSPESGESPVQPEGKVAKATWKSATADDATESPQGEASLASHQSTSSEDASLDTGAGAAIRIPDGSAPPAEPAKLVLGGMRAHDLTGAVAAPLPQAAPIVVAPTPGVPAVATHIAVPTGGQVIYAAPAPAPVVVAPTTVTASAATSPSGSQGELIEITELPPATTNPSLQRVRGFDQPSAAVKAEAASDVFISPQMTISASTAQETRDAVAAATLAEPESPPVQSAPIEPSGWKSRYSVDES